MSILRTVIVSLALLSCQPPIERALPDGSVLEQYSRQTTLTDPGEYAFLYEPLPQSLDSLCGLIKCQLLHPFEAIQKGYSMERIINDGAISSVKEILMELVKKDSSGLTYQRKEKDRLLIACHHHAMLLTSILRSRNIPVRMRFGFSRYFEKQKGVRFGHIICEVWNATEKRWMLVDPDRHIVDFNAVQFDFASQAWINVKRNKLNPNVYISSIGNGLQGIVNLLAMDLAHVLREERMHWIYPQITLQKIRVFNDLNLKDRKTLDYAAGLLKDPDRNHMKLDSIYHHTTGLQPSLMNYEEYCKMMEEKYGD